jgi:hypothetical protein
VGESWRPIPGWPYEASSRGRIRSAARAQVLKRTPDRDGYLHVTLSDGPTRRRYVHVARLVLEAFAGLPPAPLLEACHRNGKRRDCRPRNLYWGTRAQNRADRERHRLEAGAGGEGGKGEEGSREAEIDEPAPCPMAIGPARADSRR